MGRARLDAHDLAVLHVGGHAALGHLVAHVAVRVALLDGGVGVHRALGVRDVEAERAGQRAPGGQGGRALHAVSYTHLDVYKRQLLEHRALWLYLLTDEAAKAGADPAAFAPAAVKRCGLFQGAELVAKGGGTNSLKSLKKGLFGKPAQMVFEMDVKDVQDDRFELEFHYCPLVKAWQKQGCTDEEISNLCDWAMCGDRGTVSYTHLDVYKRQPLGGLTRSDWAMAATYMISWLIACSRRHTSSSVSAYSKMRAAVRLIVSISSSYSVPLMCDLRRSCSQAMTLSINS